MGSNNSLSEMLRKYNVDPATVTKNNTQKNTGDDQENSLSAMLNKYVPSYSSTSFDSFKRRADEYFSSANEGLKHTGYSNAQANAEERRKQAEELRKEAIGAELYLENNKAKYGEASYQYMKKYLADINAEIAKVTDAFDQTANYYSQFTSKETLDDYRDSLRKSSLLEKYEGQDYSGAALLDQDREFLDEYHNWKKANDEYNLLSGYDIHAGNREISDLEVRLAADEEEYWKLYEQRSNYAAGATPGYQDDVLMGIEARMQEILDKYGAQSIDEIRGQLTQKKQLLNRAKHLQEGITLAGVINNDDFADLSGYVSTKNDSALSKLTSQYGLGYDDLTYEYINGADNGVRDEINHQHQLYSHGPGDSRSIYQRNNYDYMTDDQIATYNYYYARDGKEAADKYLYSIQESLNYQAATDRFRKLEGKTALELVFGIEAGFDQFKSGVTSLLSDEDYINRSATQMTSGMVREDLKDADLPLWYNFKDKKWEKKVFGMSAGQMAYDTITTTTNMAPSILASVAANFFAPGSGAVVGSALMGASAAGNSYQEMLNAGYDKQQARAYSTLVGASEASLQYLLGGIGSLGGKYSVKAITNAVSGVDKAFVRIAAKYGSMMLSEGIEEGLQEVLNPIFQNLIMHTDEKVNWEEVAYSALLGALTAGVMEGAPSIVSDVSTYKTGKQLKAADISAQRLAEIGSTFSADTVAHKLAGKVNENTGAYTLGTLFNEIGATLTEQNVNDITEALVKSGIPSEMAKDKAQLMARIVEGATMSEELIEAINDDSLLAKAVVESIIDPNTTWNQRTQAYNQALMDLANEKAGNKQAKQNAPTPNAVDTQTEEAAQATPEAEKADTNPANVSSISKIENGQVTVKMEDGTEISVQDADLSADEGVRIETIAKMEGISANDANFILDTLRSNTGVSAQVGALGAKEAYRYGFYGFAPEHMTTHGVFSNALTDSQRNAIYDTGRAARQRQVDNKNATVANKKATTEKTSATGKVHYEGNRDSLTERQSASLNAMEKIADALGIQIYVFESEVDARGKRVGANGWYNAADNSIHIDLHAGNNGEGVMLFTAAHELTHFIRQWSPAKFKVLADFLMQEYGKAGVNVDALVREQINKAKRNERTISYDAAYEEVVADSMEMMLADGKVMEKLAKLKAQDKSLWQKIKDFINELAVKIRAVYDGMSPDSVEGRYVSEMVDAIEKLQDLFAEGLVEASENYKMSEKNIAQYGGAELFSFRGKNKDGIEVYETSEHVKSLSWTERKKLFLQMMRNQYRGRTAKFVRNGHAYYATFEYRDVSKNIYGDTASDPKGRDAKINVGADGNIFELVEHSEYFLSEAERGKNQRMHRGVKYWDYFIKTVQIDRNVYDVLAHIRKKDTGNFVYDIEMYENKKIEPSSPEDSLESGRKWMPNSSNSIIGNESGTVKNESTEAIDIVVDSDTESVAPAVLFSERTWTESDYVQEREKAAAEIAKAIGVSKKKAKSYIDSVNSIAKMIAEDRVRLDYFSSPGRSSFVSNVEYGGSFDFSTLCKKRRLLTGTFTAIQKALPNTALTANEILDIRNRMKDAGLEVSCGLCYVEGSRANMGQFAKEFLKLYKQYYPDAWQPNMADVNTPDGIEWVRINHPEAYEQYEYFWNHYGTLKPGDKNLFASQQKPKLYQLHTEYKGEILEKFNDDDNVEEKNLNGGIRLQSFSDFEIVHLIDTMQIIMDMSRVGLAGQAYTKVPDFAWALGDTGLKINLSLIAKGVDENGKLIFDDVEGMPIADAIALRDRYSKNVGTILVAFNDEQLLAAMADDRVDFIIPFHRSQWKKSQYAAMGLPAKTKDYTYMQNEKFIKPQYHEYRGRMVKDKATNYMPNEYWDFSKSGKDNAEAYLEMCARNNKRPKFYKLLQNNGDGSYSLKADGSTDGYWKLLIDFKMYDNKGNGSPQMPVKPDFNMDEATRMLNDYSGGHSNFPVAQGVVDDFVKEYKGNHKGVKFSDRDSEGNQLTEDQMEFFENSKVRDYQGRLIPVYHGTFARDFFEFANGDVGFHFGTRGQALDRVNGDPEARVIEAYLNIKNPLYAAFDFGDWGGKYVAEMLIETEQFEDHENQEKIERKLSDISRLATENQADAELRKYLHSLGYDGIVYENRFEDSGSNDLSYIAFDANQIKLTSNTNPTSNPDIRFSERDTESVSNRSLLANAFEGAAQTETEKKKIQEYRDNISKIEAEESKLADLNKRIKELSFAKGKRDTSAIKALRDEATKTANRISNYDKILVRMEASKPIQNILEREKQQAYDRAKQKGEKALESYRQKEQVKQLETMRDYREARAALKQQKSETAVMEKEFIRIAKAYEKLEAKTTTKSGKDAAAITSLKNALKEETKKHKADQKTWETEFNRLMLEYEASGRNIVKLEEKIEHQKQMAKQRVESREKTAMRNKIKNVVHDLNQYLLKGTKDRHVPIELQKAVAEALDAVNMDTVGAEERIAKLEAELLKAKTPEKIQEISRKIDYIRDMGGRMTERLENLKKAYDQFLNSDDPMVANSYDEVISEKLKAVIESVGDTPLRDMSISQLEDVYDMYQMVLTTVRNANKAFKAKKSESISAIAGQVMNEIKKVGGSKKLARKGTEGLNTFFWNNLKPVYAFKHIGSNHFSEVFDNVRAGEDVWAVDVTEARKFYLDQSKKYDYNSWDFEERYKFTSTSGMDFELNLEQIMSLYAYSKRAQAAEHLKRGGIVIDETTEITVKNKLGIPVKFNPTEATAYNISDAALADIIGKLTNEQKDFVDVMQDYLSTVMGAKGNEVSLEMYGIKLFKEKYYFPLKSAQQFMAKAKEQQKGEVKIKNSGFSKETVRSASNPIVLTPFMNVWANHVNEMSMYHAFVLPLEDFYRVYNYKTATSDTSAIESVEMLLQNAYGRPATKYIDQLLKDLNGGAVSDNTTGVINKMMNLFKKGAVFASLSVVIQQPSAFARAFALVDSKYFIGPKIDHKRHKALWEEVKHYAPVAIIKEMGYFDTNMGKSTQDFILGNEYSGFSEKMKALFTDSGFRDEALSKAPALADEIAWCGIWEAVKRETKANNHGMEVNSEAFLKKCGERFTEVIVKTQVYDSVLSRSGNMRSKDTGMKMATAFMAEPTTSINMIADALLQGKRGNRKYARGAIGAVIASQILNSILVSFVYAGRDDDENETYWEKYIGTLTGQFLDSLNPASYIPFIKDIVSIVKGYDVERSDMSVISDLWKAWEDLRKDTVSPYRKVEGFAGSIAQIFGLPVKNIMRDARGIYNTINSFVNGQETTKAGVGYALKSALPALAGGGDVTNQEQLYAAFISDDDAHRARVESRYKDQKAVTTAMRAAIKEHFTSGDIDADTAVKYLINYCGDEKEEAFWKVEKWKYESNAEDAFAKYNEFYGAVQTGKDLKSIIKKYTDNGVTASTLKEQITEYFKPLYKDMSTSEKAGIKGYLLNAMTILGDSREDAEKKVSAWEFEDEYGFNYDEKRQQFFDGKISASDMKSVLMEVDGKTADEASSSIVDYTKDAYKAGFFDRKKATKIMTSYGGLTADEAKVKLAYIDMKKKFPDIKVDDAWVDKYYNEVETSGISIETYIDYRNKVMGIGGKDMKERRMAIIDAMPISNAQKDALYYAEGWAASRLHEAPWH